MSVFALIVAGRMVQTDFTALKEMEYMIEIPDAESINHLVIFLTGLQPLPVAYGGSIYISWTPIGGGERQWNYLGFINNEKPIEPMVEISRRNEGETSTNEQLSSIAQFPEKMLRNFVNFMHSFAVSFPKPNGGQEEYIPSRSVTEWFTNFKRKLETNPNFWKSLP